MDQNNNYTNNNQPNPNDKGGFLWGALGCCVPVVGLILFLVWKQDKPITAKALGIGAIIGGAIAIVNIIVLTFILPYIIGFSSTMAMYGMY